MYQKRRAIENVLVLALDLGAMFLAFVLAVFLRYGTFWWAEAEGNQSQQIIIMAILYTALHVVTNYYSAFFRRKNMEELVSILKEEAVFYILLLIVYFLIHSTNLLSRMMTIYLVILQTLFMFLFRVLFKHYMITNYRQGRFSRRLILITRRGSAVEIIRRLKASADWMSLLSGVILLDGAGDEAGDPADEGSAGFGKDGVRDPETAGAGGPVREDIGKHQGSSEEGGTGQSTDKFPAGSSIEGVPVVAGKQDLLGYIVHTDVDEVFFSCEGIEKDPECIRFINEIQMMGILVDVDIEVFNLVDNGKKTINRVGDYAVVSFARNIISTRGAIAKRLMDLVGGVIGLFFCGLFSLVIVPVIKLDSPGPAIFSQTRVGKNGRRFKLYKFRSMYVDAEQRKAELMQKNEMSGLMFKMENDPRITRVGRFLRKTSLDEFPQFWNVVKGDMSLVGTRPPTEDEFEQYSTMHKARLSMTPGLTGIWQTSGRSDIKDFDDILRMDMQYIDNWSIGLDIKLLLKTIPVVFGRHGAE